MTYNTYEISTGANFFYTKASELAAIYFNLELTENINAAALQEAVNLTMARFPYFATKLEVTDSGDRYLLRSNSTPFVVYEQSDFLPLNYTKANDYLMTICFSGTKLYLLFFHGLTDGLGANSFIKTLLYTYLCKSTGKKFECPNVMDVNSFSDSTEYCDLYQFLPELPKFQPFRFEEPFSFPENQIDETRIRLYSIHVPLEILSSKSSQSEGSVSGLLSLILSRAIDAVHPNSAKPIVISCPADLRKMLNCENTLRNCNQSIKYVYSDKLKKYPLEQQLSMSKGMLYIQSIEEHHLPRYAKARDMLKKANETRTISEKKEIYSDNSGLATVPIISYVGSFEAGECNDHIISISGYSKVLGKAGMLAMALCLNDQCEIKITSNLTTDAYYFSLLEQFKMLKIPYLACNPVDL